MTQAISAPSAATTRELRVRWLGRVPYREAHDLQSTLFDLRVDSRGEDYLLLLEHPHTYTLGRRTDPSHLLLDESEYRAAGAEVIPTNRGGDVTYHGPGQLVAYPILRLGPTADVVRHVRNLEEIVIRTVAGWGVEGERDEGMTGVWVALPDGRRGKICAIGCRVTRGVTMHGLALNVAPDMDYWGHIVPCGIEDPGRTVVSLADLLGDAAPPMADVATALAAHAADVFGRSAVTAGESWTQTEQPPREKPRRIVPLRVLAVEAGPDIKAQARERPDWLRNRARLADPGYMELKAMMRRLDLHTVCEEAGCPNIYECWSERTATLMLLGGTCTRSCGFCEVHTGKPASLDTGEPQRAAEAVAAMDLAHAVLTSVARDDLADGGAGIFAESIRRIHAKVPGCAVEVLVPDFKGDAAAATTVFDARPEVFNHNLETVARLQRLARPQAGYARSLTILARAKRAGLTTKSGIICGMGETEDEIVEAMGDLAAVGVDILTLGQYLRPSGRHLPVDRWVTPAEFERLRVAGEAMGFAHVESGPLVRSSYHARTGAGAAGATVEAP